MNMKMKTFCMAALILAVAGRAAARDLTAFELIKAGDPYVGIQSKDKVVEIHSEKSVAGLTPDIWHVVYYDPDATFKSVEVKFGAGKEMETSHPMRMFQMAGNHEALDRSTLKVDSDQALKIARAQPLLKKLTLRASQLTLQRGDEGPVWNVRFWAAKLDNPDKQVDIGVVTLSATDGSVVKSDLHPDKVD